MVGAFSALTQEFRNAVSNMVSAVPGTGVVGNILGGIGDLVPSHHSGDVVQGPPGADVLALLRVGERIVTPGGTVPLSAPAAQP